MTVELHPEDEKLIKVHLAKGGFADSAEVIHRALSELHTGVEEGTAAISFGPRPKTPAEAVAHIRESRKGNRLPTGVTIKDLIDEGRA